MHLQVWNRSGSHINDGKPFRQLELIFFSHANMQDHSDLKNLSSDGMKCYLTSSVLTNRRLILLFPNHLFQNRYWWEFVVSETLLQRNFILYHVSFLFPSPSFVTNIFLPFVWVFRRKRSFVECSRAWARLLLPGLITSTPITFWGVGGCQKTGLYASVTYFIITVLLLQ